jgi:hypothetical protein
MPYFGDVMIPWVTDKDTSITKDIVEKNFVDKPPQVYEITPDLESGTYSAILNETVHDKGESFEEQQDAVLSMVSRHGTEFPFDVSGDDGYISVSSATTSIDPRQEIREAEIDIRFLDSDDYNGSIVANPFPYRGGSYDSQVEPHESFLAFPSSINVVGKTPEHTLSASEGDIDLYIISQKEVVEYEENGLDSQRESICRLFNSKDERLYSDSRVVDSNSTVNNTLLRCTYNSISADIEFYDETWESVGSVQLPFNQGYASDNTNDNVNIIFRNGNESEVRRGFSFIRFSFSNESSFDFDSDATLISDEDFYAHWEDSSERDIIIVRTSSDGNFYTDASQLGIDSLSSSEEYDVYLAVVPSEIAVDDYARYVYNIGSRRRSFVQ